MDEVSQATLDTVMALMDTGDSEAIQVVLRNCFEDSFAISVASSGGAA